MACHKKEQYIEIFNIFNLFFDRQNMCDCMNYLYYKHVVCTRKIQRIEQTCTQTALCIINFLTFAVLNAYFIFKKIEYFALVLQIATLIEQMLIAET